MPIVTGENDQELLIQIAGSDMPAFHVLYQRHFGELRAYIHLFTRSEEDTEDILQELFIKLWEKRESLPVIVGVFVFDITLLILFTATIIFLISCNSSNTGLTDLPQILYS